MFSQHDRLRVLFYLANVHDLPRFRAAMIAAAQAVGRAPPARMWIRDNFRRWFKEGNKPHGTNMENLTSMLSRQLHGQHAPDVRQLLDSSDSMGAFLFRCGISFEELRAHGVIQDAAKAAWARRYDGVQFLEAIRRIGELRVSVPPMESSPQARRRSDAASLDWRKQEREAFEKYRARRKAIMGVYYLYRHHSMLNGLLRETMVIHTMESDRLKGTYYQFHKSGGQNRINFDTFDVGLYTISFAAHTHVPRRRPPHTTEELRTEIITIRILQRPYELTLGEPGAEKTAVYFAGLLSGIYDDGDTLMAERVLLKKERDITGYDQQSDAPRRLTARDDETRWYADLVSNHLDGQVLSMRYSRLEEMLLRYDGPTDR